GGRLAGGWWVGWAATVTPSRSRGSSATSNAEVCRTTPRESLKSRIAGPILKCVRPPWLRALRAQVFAPRVVVGRRDRGWYRHEPHAAGAGSVDADHVAPDGLGDHRRIGRGDAV